MKTLTNKPTRKRGFHAANVAVVGLGRFGSALALELVASGHQVLGIDFDEKVVQAHAANLTHVVSADTTDEETLRELGLADMDSAVVAIGADLESSFDALGADGMSGLLPKLMPLLALNPRLGQSAHDADIVGHARKRAGLVRHQCAHGQTCADAGLAGHLGNGETGILASLREGVADGHAASWNLVALFACRAAGRRRNT